MTQTVKAIFGSEIRRLPYPIILDNSSLTAPKQEAFEVFVFHLRTTFNIAPNNLMKISYVDDEGDNVSISSKIEFEEAFTAKQGKILRLTINSTPDASCSKPKKVFAQPKQEEFPLLDTTEDKVQAWKDELAKKKEEYSAQLKELTEKYDFDVPESVLLKQLIISNGNIEFVIMKQQTKKNQKQQKEQKLNAIKEKYCKQVTSLVEMGFPMDPPRCIWLLQKHNGDISKVIDDLNAKQKHHEDSADSNTQKCGSSMKELKEKYSEQLCELEAMGFNSPRLIWLLKKYNGDIQKVFVHLQQRMTFTSNMLEKYGSQLQLLNSKGFTCLPVNIRLLNKFDGDVAKVEAKLQQRKAWSHQNAGRRGFWKKFTHKYNQKVAATAI